MNNRLVVATQCPSCGAHLEFVEGSNAARCEYCQTRSLLTGRRRILTYYLPPKTTESQALECLKKALMAGAGPRRVLRIHLLFIPYYRITGHDFIWQRTPPRPQREVEDELEALTESLIGSDSVRLQGEHWSFTSTTINFQEPQSDFEVQGRYLEKNFLALDIPGLGAYSLGVRAAVMKLRLYDKESMQAEGRIAALKVDAEAAMARGLEFSESEEIRRREVLARVLSVIFFPFWIVETERRGEGWISVIDGISGSLTRTDLPASALAGFEEAQAPEVETVGFLPMVCPDCGWGLSGHSDGVIFSCATCFKAWLLGADRLSPVERRTAAPAAKRGGRLKYMPFWVFGGEGKGPAARLYVPAFRYRRLQALHDNARQMFRRQPEFELADPQEADLEGCFYDREDARLLAEFMLAGLPDTLPEKQRAVSTAVAPTLIWLPYSAKGTGWANPFTGTVLQSALLAT